MTRRWLLATPDLLHRHRGPFLRVWTPVTATTLPALSGAASCEPLMTGWALSNLNREGYWP